MIAIELMIRTVPNDYQYKNDYLKKNGNQIEVLFLGSSHAYYGINPEYIELNSFNASEVSQSIKYDYLILDKYIDHLKELKVIFLDISYFSLFNNLEESVEPWRVKYYNLYYNLNSHPFSLKYNYEVLDSDIYNTIREIAAFYIKNKSKIFCNRLGYGLSYKNQQDLNLDITGINAAKRHTKSDSNNFNYNVLLIKQMINLSKKHGVNEIVYLR